MQVYNMDELYTVKEVSKKLKVNIHKVYELVNAGLLPALKLGSLKIRKETLEDFMIKYEGKDLTDLNNICDLQFNNIEIE